MDDALYHQDSKLYEQINQEILESVEQNKKQHEKIQKQNEQKFEFKLENIDECYDKLRYPSKKDEYNNDEKVKNDKDIGQTRIPDDTSSQPLDSELESSGESAGYVDSEEVEEVFGNKDL